MSTGNPYEASAAPRQPVSKATLLLLTFFLGGVGAHKFYLGKHVQGFLYALFCWTLIPAIVATIELLVYAASSSGRLNQRYEAQGAPLLIAAGCAAFVTVLFGLLAYLALAAYSDYQARTKVGAVTSALFFHRLPVTEYRERNGQFPAAGSESPGRDMPVPHTRSVRMARGGAIVAEFNGEIRPELDGRALVMVPSEGKEGWTWRCGVREAELVRNKLIPSTCRELIALP